MQCPRGGGQFMAKSRTNLSHVFLALLVFATLFAGAAQAQVAKQGNDTLSSLSFRSERLQVAEELEAIDNVPGLVASATQTAWSSFRLTAPTEWPAVGAVRRKLDHAVWVAEATRPGTLSIASSSSATCRRSLRKDRLESVSLPCLATWACAAPANSVAKTKRARNTWDRLVRDLAMNCPPPRGHCIEVHCTDKKLGGGDVPLYRKCRSAIGSR